jgi:hypothetical protein
MWTTLAVLAALGSTVSAEPSSLKLSRPRLTYGLHGPVRQSADLLPGDSLDIAYDIEGLAVAPSGEVEYSTVLEIFDKEGKSLFKQEGKPQKTILSLGGNQLPAMAHLDVGVASPAGKYKVQVTVNDLIGKRSQMFTQDVEVKPATFGIVRVTTTSNSEGTNPTAVPGRGEALFVNFAVVNFQRRGDKQEQPHVTFEMQVFDAKGKPTTPKPLTGTVKEMVPVGAPAVPGQFFLSLNRAGTFRVVLKATCQISGKSAEVSFPLAVVSPK